MVDPNPARGMPLQLQRYWLVGKGAAKIRWGLPHDFNRCVRNLRKYFPKNPEGLCNILHTKALGQPPGKGHGHSLIASASSGPGYEEAQTLIATMPMLGKNLWAGPLAPIGRLTEEPRRKRVFEHGALRHRVLPLPLDWREKTSPAHEGAVTVGRILGISYGPNEAGLDFAWGWGDFLDEEIIPDSKKARYLVEQGVVGTSIDPGGPITVTVDPLAGVDHVMQYTIGGATLVPVPAFSYMRLNAFDDTGDWPDDDVDMVMNLMEGDEDGSDCGCGAPSPMGVGVASMAVSTFAVNSSGWKGLPLAPRDAVFDNDDAVKRIQAWAQVSAEGADVDKLRRAFMWHDPRLPETNTTSYRLPVGDVINGRLTLIYHAIYAAAALLSGAHGGLPDVPDEDKNDLRNVISEIYPVMATEFNDSSIRAPWDRSAQEGVQLAMDTTTSAGDVNIVFAADNPKEPYGDVAYADPGYQDDGKKRYPLDTEEHCRAAWSYINMPKNAAKYDPKELKLIKGRIKAALKKYGVQVSDEASSSDDYAMSDEGYPITPPAAWFKDPVLPDKTPLTVEPSGRLFGHLAAWNECHRDVTMRECVLAPKSKQEYAPFHLGRVITAEGDALPVGKIVMDTGHADIRFGYAAAASHYDNTGSEIAIVRAGEDEFGIWVAGSVVPEATPRNVAKLRRSPLSGDWRRERGNLELTAALAVNAPAFPVYSMENEEQMSLVAAGTVMQEFEEQHPAPPTGIDLSMVASMVREQIEKEDEQAERAQRLADILEDEEILAQRERARRLSKVFAMDSEAAPAPAQAAAPVPADAPAPAGDEVQSDEAVVIAQNANARYSIVEEPAGGSEVKSVADRQAPQAPVAPEAPVPVG